MLKFKSFKPILLLLMLAFTQYVQADETEKAAWANPKPVGGEYLITNESATAKEDTLGTASTTDTTDYMFVNTLVNTGYEGVDPYEYIAEITQNSRTFMLKLLIQNPQHIRFRYLTGDSTVFAQAYTKQRGWCDIPIIKPGSTSVYGDNNFTVTLKTGSAIIAIRKIKRDQSRLNLYY